MVAITIASTAYAEENTGAETATASIGDVAFSLTNEQAYFDVLYKYPDEFELEIKRRWRSREEHPSLPCGRL